VRARILKNGSRHSNAPERLFSGLASYPDHDVDTRKLGAAREVGKTPEFHFGYTDIDELTSVEVMKVIVKTGVRIEAGACRIYIDLTQQALCGEEIQRVVDRRLGNVSAGAAQALQDLLSRQMLGRSEHEFAHPDALLRRRYAVGVQEACYFLT
jgi:hypothetical protein